MLLYVSVGLGLVLGGLLVLYRDRPYHKVELSSPRACSVHHGSDYSQYHFYFYFIIMFVVIATTIILLLPQSH